MTSRPPRRETIRLGPGGEFDLIRTFLASGGVLPDAVRVGPGDDAAVIDAGQIAVSTDLSVEEVHFRRAWLTPEEIGWRAGASALSDLAAVAAEPVAVLVSLALSAADVESGWGERLVSGVRDAADRVGAALVGGDVSRSPAHAAIDVVVLGRVEHPVLRDGARPGDEVWVTGSLGGAGTCLALLQAGRSPSEDLRARFARPLPRIREALWLREQVELHAMIDLSDGLAGDAAHVAAASQVAIDVDLPSVPIAAGVESAAPESGDALALALSSGEDYELCMVAAAGALEPLMKSFQERFALPLGRVGQVRAGEGVWARNRAGELHRLERGGFSHFSRAGSAGDTPVEVSSGGSPP